VFSEVEVNLVIIKHMSTMFFEDDKDDSLVGDFAAAAEHGYEAAKAEDKAKKEAEAKEKEEKRDKKIEDSLK
jgi:hypothetical protein